MNPVVVMVTVTERAAMLDAFLGSLAEYMPGMPIAIHLQGEHPAPPVMPRGVELAHLRLSRERMGCHAARVILQQDLAGQGFDTYVNVDDDVLLTPTTHWEPAMRKSLVPGNGFVLTNWVRHPNLYAAAVLKMAESFPRQVMVYNGGGMAYGEEVAELMRGLDPTPARFDDLWPVTAYVSGRLNYRYRGSLSIHNIRSAGGMHTYMRSEPRPLLSEQWIDYEYALDKPPGRNVHIPMDSRLKPAAREAHRAARKAAGW